ncbi:MAG TPA: DNA primase [Myxococcota bacterium]|jgi:DNA primase|nr:DNA primase [Myxococcota bacterium]
MGGIPDDVLQEVRARADIIQVIGSFVSLKKAGTRYKALCPFHSEKTPSFHVQPQVGRYHCFGCQANGDVFEFIMRHEGKTFPEAVREVAARVGVEVPEVDEAAVGAGGGRGRERRDRREELLAVNDLACEFFEKCLADARWGAPGRAYLDKRGLPGKVWETHRLGYAPERWDAMVRWLSKKGVKPADAVELGLCVARDRGTDAPDGRGTYDRFRNRVIFPVLGTGGRVVGFGGRTLSADKQTAKYINSPESDLYKKGRELYGLHAARRAIRAAKQCVLVEGNIDVLSLCAAGVENVVAIMGTALTADQARLLKRYTADVVLCFDGDAAGRAAALKSAPIVLESGLAARVVSLGDGEDPDSLVRRLGPETAARTLREMVAAAPELVEHVVQHHLRGADGTVPGKLHALNECAAVLWRVVDDLARGLYVRRVAELLDVREEDVREAVRRAARSRLDEVTRPTRAAGGSAAGDGPAATGPGTGEGLDYRLRLEVRVCALLLRFASVRAIGRALGASSHVATRILKDLCERLCAPEGAALTAVAGMEGLEGVLREAVSASLADESTPTEDVAGRELPDCLARIEELTLDEELVSLPRLIQEAQRTGDLNREYELNGRLMELKQRLKHKMAKAGPKKK